MDQVSDLSTQLNNLNLGENSDIFALDEVNEKLLIFLKTKNISDSRIKSLSLAYAKYDWHGCPQNWIKKYDFKHERFIYKWAKYSLNDE